MSFLLQCFINCMFEHNGSIDSKGEAQRDAIVKHFIAKHPTAKKEAVEALTDKCIKEKGTDKCDTAFLRYKCYWANKAQLA